MQEQVKFLVFQVPGSNAQGNTTYFRAKVIVEALNSDFYPIIYFNKQEMLTRPTDLASLKFPTIAVYDFVAGENPYTVLGLETFTYTFTGFATKPWTYYALAVYDHNWGLTDMRKSQFQIRVETSFAEKCEVVSCTESPFPTP